MCKKCHQRGKKEYSSTPDNRADPNKRAGRKFNLDFYLYSLTKLVSILAEKSLRLISVHVRLLGTLEYFSNFRLKL